ncbi:unnamed protein product [Danaus chrysippus]|uniref:(African queen) hypothetical protein n=1 Tax=Danaus chrysippus TaxID=151541 RepID=A0A8J2VQG8_9NEOP|nr:unnamed protein product [Danaus chrysippus]
MDDLHLPPMKDGDLNYKLSERTPEEGTLKDEIPVHIMDMTDLKLSNMENSFDVKEFNEITKSMRNITDAYKNTPGILSRRYYYQDSEDNIGKDKTIKENDKKEKLINLMITFLIHARYQIKKGLAEKHPLRGDTRYRIGYLFNRLRHLQYEQQKLVSAAQKQRNHHKFSLYSMTKLYEKLVRCDVDIRDTIKYLEEINSKRVNSGVNYTNITIPSLDAMFKSLSEDVMDDYPSNMVVKRLSIDLEKLDMNNITKKLEAMRRSLNDSDDGALEEFNTRRLGSHGEGWQRERATELLERAKIYDIMLQLIYQARHKVKQIESETYYNPKDTSYRIAFLYRRIRRIWKRMNDVYTTMQVNK